MEPKNFSKASTSYIENASVQKRMAQNLIEILIKNYGKNFEDVLEIGSGTGFLTDNIVEHLNCKNIILNDITQNLTRHNFEFIQGDATKKEFNKQFDLIISSSAFQWFENFEDFLSKIKKNLKKNGLLVFSSFSDRNFEQFKKILNTSLNYVDYHTALNNKGFEILTFEKEIQTLYFNSPKEILKHVKNTGVGMNNEYKWSKKTLETFESEYIELFKDEKGVELTYNPVYVVTKVK